MKSVLHIVAGVPATLFVLIGLAWWVAPEFVGAQLGMPMLEGVGASTQVGDLGSFFLTLGSCVLIGLGTGNRVWFYPSIMLLGLASFGRVLAWLFHDAALAYDMIAVEVVSIAALFFVSGKLTEPRRA